MNRKSPNLRLLLSLAIALGVFTVIVKILLAIGSKKNPLEDVKPYLRPLPSGFDHQVLDETSHREKYLQIKVEEFEKEEITPTPSNTR